MCVKFKLFVGRKIIDKIKKTLDNMMPLPLGTLSGPICVPIISLIEAVSLP
jgi:hypothetical protein